jgi:predicted nucleic acid-binding protein
MKQPDTTALINLLRGSNDDLAREAIDCLESGSATVEPATSGIPMHEVIEIYERRAEISRAGLGVDGNFDDVVEELRRSTAESVHIQEFRCADKHAYLVFCAAPSPPPGDNGEGMIAILRIARTHE